MVDIGHGFFMVKFDMHADREKVISGAPWMVFDHYLAVRPWVPDFISSEVKIDKTLVWIRFPSLGMEYYEKSVLLALATTVRRPIKVDINTVEANRGRFAKVCVEIQLDQPVVGKVWFRGHWFQVEYEGLHLLCKKCGVFGHIARACTSQASSSAPLVKNGNNVTVVVAAPHPHDTAENPSIDEDVSIMGDIHGEWLVVNKGKRQSKPQGRGPQDKISRDQRGAN